MSETLQGVFHGALLCKPHLTKVRWTAETHHWLGDGKCPDHLSALQAFPRSTTLDVHRRRVSLRPLECEQGQSLSLLSHEKIIARDSSPCPRPHLHLAHADVPSSRIHAPISFRPTHLPLTQLACVVWLVASLPPLSTRQSVTRSEGWLH